MSSGNSNVIHNVRKKKNENTKVSNNPLPILVTSNSDKESSWTFFRGLFLFSSVIIQNDEQAQILWENGCFGDRSISNSSSKNYQKSNKSTEENFHVKKSKKYSVTEVLHLCLEEALFLSYALGKLILTNEQGIDMTIDNMWDSFTLINPKFPLQYAVYHHFRVKGWVVKPGLKFGGDWVLYPVGPQYYHSQYIVWAQCIWQDTLEEDYSLSDHQNGITAISAIERLSSHVGKSFMICQVLRPRDLEDKNLKNIDCLKKFIVSEVILCHWTPNQEVPKPNEGEHASKGFKRPCANT